MALYYVVLRGWLGLLSLVRAAPSEVLLRLPSALFAVAATVVVFVLGRRMFGRVASVVGAGLFLANVPQMLLAQTARAYSLALLLLCLSWLALFTALIGNRRIWWAIYVAATVLSVYALLFAGLVIVSQVIALGLLLALPSPWQARVRGAMRPLAAPLALTFVLVLPIGVDALIHGGPNSWIPPVNVGDFRALIHFLGGGSRTYERVVFGAAALSLLLAAGVYVPRLSRFRRGDRETLGTAAAIGAWIAVPVVISFALTQPGLNLHLFYPRYLVVVVPPICLLAGLLVETLPSRALQVLLAMALALVSWSPLALYYQSPPVQNFSAPVQWIHQHYQSGDGLVCDPEVQCGIPIAYYLQANPGPAKLDSDSPGRFSWETNSTLPVTHDAIRAYAGHHRRLFFIFGPLGHTPAVESDAASLEAELTADGYRLVVSFDAPGTAATIRVGLYETAAGGP